MIKNIEEKRFDRIFQKADDCRQMKNDGLSLQDIASLIQEPVNRIEQLIKMSEAFPPGIRIYNVPIGIYQAAALFPEPLKTVARAWENSLQPDDLYEELSSWAKRFDALGYGDPPCLTSGHQRQRQTPLEEALGIDEEGMTTARKLYEFLELDPTHYSRWAKKNIYENDFADINIDYFPLAINGERGSFGGFNPNQTRDYKITGRFAKKLAMASRSPKGEQVRDYFIAVEQRAKALANGQYPTDDLPADVLLGIVNKYGDRLNNSTVERIIKLALPRA